MPQHRPNSSAGRGIEIHTGGLITVIRRAGCVCIQPINTRPRVHRERSPCWRALMMIRPFCCGDGPEVEKYRVIANSDQTDNCTCRSIKTKLKFSGRSSGGRAELRQEERDRLGTGFVNPHQGFRVWKAENHDLFLFLSPRRTRMIKFEMSSHSCSWSAHN